MTIRMLYQGTADVRIIKRANLTAVGLPDPGVDYTWSKSTPAGIDVPNATAAFLLSMGGEFAAANGVGFGDFFAGTPIKTISEGASLALGVVASTWHDVDPAGSAASRPTDIVIPNVSAGQWVKVDLNCSSSGSAAFVGLDMWTIVGSVAINQCGVANVSGNGGVAGWKLVTSTFSAISGHTWYLVQAGDIENGNVRLRLRDLNPSTTARSIAASFGYRLTLVGTGPFG